MNIKTKIYNNTFIGCCEMECNFKAECSTHILAGEYRREAGFTPELSKTGNSFICKTYGEQPMQSDESFAQVPQNFKSLSKGALNTGNFKDTFSDNKKIIKFRK